MVHCSLLQPVSILRLIKSIGAKVYITRQVFPALGQPLFLIANIIHQVAVKKCSRLLPKSMMLSILLARSFREFFIGKLDCNVCSQRIVAVDLQT